MSVGTKGPISVKLWEKAVHAQRLGYPIGITLSHESARGEFHQADRKGSALHFGRCVTNGLIG